MRFDEEKGERDHLAIVLGWPLFFVYTPYQIGILVNRRQEVARPIITAKIFERGRQFDQAIVIIDDCLNADMLKDRRVRKVARNVLFVS